MRMRVLLLLLCATSAFAEDSLRTYAGGFSTRWKTRGAHGHDQDHPCADQPYTGCDGPDFYRGNLDNSIGYRFGMERDFVRAGIFRVVGGADSSLSFSEYNISQNDILIFGTALTAGVDVTRWGFRLGARYGGGGYLTTTRDFSYDYHSRYGFQTFHELVGSVPLRSGASLRIAQRYVGKTVGFAQSEGKFYPLEGPVEVTETSVMFVASPHVRDSLWEFSTSSGAAKPGGTGSTLNLKESGWHRLTASRVLPWFDLHARATWTASAHESRLHTDFRGYPGNERSKTVDAFGLGLAREWSLGNHFSVLTGGGMEVADWRDEHHLLVNEELHDVIGGVEFGLAATGALRFKIGRGTALEANVEQIHWTGISYGETRYGVGLVLTR
jgi:hypothetical protein